MNFSLSTVFVALAMSGLTLAGVVPLEKRQTETGPQGCQVSLFGTGIPLAVRPAGQGYNGPITYVGIVPGVKHEGIDGQQDSILVTKDANGQPLTSDSSSWELCTLPNNAGSIVRPFNTTQHCLALESTADSATGARNSLLDSYCDQVPTQYKAFRTSYSGENYQGGEDIFLEFAGEDTTVVISDTAHGELQFFTNEADSGGKQVMQLQLLVPHAN